MQTKFFIFIVTTLAALVANLALAKNIDLYDEPKDNAKKVGMVDSEVGIIPIFTPKNSAWLKVADPRNGNTGWVKSSALADTQKSNSFTFTEKVISNGSTPPNYRIIQFGDMKPLSPEQSKALYDQYRAHQLQWEKDMQKMLQEVYKNAQMILPSFPMLVPVVVVPAVPPASKTAPAAATSNKEVGTKK